MVTRPSAARGFTLPELLAVVAIMSILAATAAPAVTALIAGQRARSASSDLFTSLNRARSEAIKRNTAVTLRPETAGSWQSGWRIPNPSDTGHPIEVHNPLTGATVTGPASVVYLPNGRIRAADSVSFDISFANAAKHRCVTIDLSGRPYLKNDAC
ncbi:GspH/FimT family pseudopilin [Massilia solisilvae]|uniref:Type II secretion system protein H n=1 Tax=Massilia solisilvae TaxID=1811225 RepID=A0ABT2BH47_9BURK|nr:GspH/FimT family pseudopilin [Massilia solisilvae]MCS0607843.1 GspH/FimT family pseudopilin [Massilia solisilvae]